MSDQTIPNYPRKISYDLLKRRGACISQLALFTYYFPEGIVLNAANIERASMVGLDLYWAVKIFLPEHARTVQELVSTMDPALSSRKAFAKALTIFLGLTDDVSLPGPAPSQ